VKNSSGELGRAVTGRDPVGVDWAEWAGLATGPKGFGRMGANRAGLDSC
ncbi:hypothetical protein CRG98_048867, partial [Punica granatum]